MNSKQAITKAHGVRACDDGSIRVTPDGKPSVFDMIRVLGGLKAPHKAWERLCEAHSEVLSGCQNFKFPGRGQRLTPVARDKEAAYQILGLLPGAAGAAYRKQAAELFVKFLDDPAALAAETVERLDKAELEWLEARIAGKLARDCITGVLQEHGVQGHGYAMCTNAVYIPILGSTAKQLKTAIAEKTGIPAKNIKTRDHLAIKQLREVETAERIAAGQVKLTNVQGNEKVAKVVRASAEYTRALLDGTIQIPGLT